MSCPAGPRRPIEREMIFNHSFSLDPKTARVDKGTWYRLSWQSPIGLTCLQKPRSTNHSLQSLLVSFPVDLGWEGLIHNLTAGTMKEPQLPQRQWLWGAAAPEGAGCHQSGVPPVRSAEGGTLQQAQGYCTERWLLHLIFLALGFTFLSHCVDNSLKITNNNNKIYPLPSQAELFHRTAGYRQLRC